MAEAYDLVVVGAGPACGPVARECRAAGWRVAVIESWKFGGVCPNAGCNPKKVLLSAPEAMAMAKNLLGKGITGVPAASWTDLMRFKRTFTEPIAEAVAKSYREAGIDVHVGRGVLTGPDTVAVGDKTLSAKKIFLAVGAKPMPLDFPGTEHVASSDDFLELDTLPRRLVFLGGGFIAFELGTIAAACGAAVTILTHGDKALRRFDQDAVAKLIPAIEAAGIEVFFNAPVHSVTREPHGLFLKAGLDGSMTLEADMIVNAAGRVAQTDGLGLEAADVAYGQAGVAVNEYLQSVSNPNVYAAGDCADTPFALTPAADMESRVAARNILHGNAHPVSQKGVPSVLFSVPPLAMVGLTEAACRKQGIAFDKCESFLDESFPWKRLGETTGYAKVLKSKADETILGAHVLGHNAEEMINILALAVRQGIPASALREQPWAYPTCGYYVRYIV